MAFYDADNRLTLAPIRSETPSFRLPPISSFNFHPDSPMPRVPSSPTQPNFTSSPFSARRHSLASSSASAPFFTPTNPPSLFGTSPASSNSSGLSATSPFSLFPSDDNTKKKNRKSKGPLACDNCRRRHAACTKVWPCTECVKHGLECSGTNIAVALSTSSNPNSLFGRAQTPAVVGPIQPHEAFIILGLNLQILYWSPSLLSLTGYRSDDLNGRLGHDIVHRSDRSRFTDMLISAVRGQGLDVVPYTNSRAELSRTSERQLLEPMAGSAVQRGFFRVKTHRRAMAPRNIQIFIGGASLSMDKAHLVVLIEKDSTNLTQGTGASFGSASSLFNAGSAPTPSLFAPPQSGSATPTSSFDMFRRPPSPARSSGSFSFGTSSTGNSSFPASQGYPYFATTPPAPSGMTMPALPRSRANSFNFKFT